MGDLKYFIKNGGSLFWIGLLVISVGICFLIFALVKSKLISVFSSLLFILSELIFISYVGLHPVLCFSLMAIWVAVLLFLAVKKQAELSTINTKNNNATYEKIAKGHKETARNTDNQANSNNDALQTNIVICPNCKSTDVDFVQNKKKSFSVGKAVAGAALTGGVGTLAGFAGKKGKNQWHCKKCGNLFETK